MTSNDSKSKVFLFGLILIGTSIFGVWLALSGNLAIRDSNADNTAGEYTYTSQSIIFVQTTQEYASTNFAGGTLQDPYSVTGYKALSKLDFNLGSIPAVSVVKFCVMSMDKEGHTKDLICQLVNAETSSAVNWQWLLPTPILVGGDNDYYCEFGLSLYNSLPEQQSAVKNISAACNLTFTPLEEVAQVATTIPGHLLHNIQIGSELLPKITYSSIANSKIVGIYAAIAGDQSLGQQQFVNICMIADKQSGCLEDYRYSPGSDSRMQSSYRALDLSISPDQGVSLSCASQEGRLGKCLVYGFVDVPKALLSETQPDQSIKLFRLSTELRQSYCENSLYYYGGSFSSTDKIQECKDSLAALY